jgi:diadenosine tetraphosphate (Ap4A) HIT family hydrolase
MGDFEPPKHLVILRTDHWVLNHRVDSALPGYLMLGARGCRPLISTGCARKHSRSLHRCRQMRKRRWTKFQKPRHFYIGRYGHTAGHAPHFHIIPVCEWVRQSFFSDPRYRVFADLSRHFAAAGATDETDGAELTLYIWRVFRENPVPPRVFRPAVHEVVERLKVSLAGPEEQGEVL